MRKLISKTITGGDTETVEEVTDEFGIVWTETSTEDHAIAYRTPEQIARDDYQLGVNTFYDDRKDQAIEDEWATRDLLEKVTSPFLNGLHGAKLAHQIQILQDQLALLDALTESDPLSY